jgi:glyoxylate reductase
MSRDRVYVTRRRVPDAIALLEKHFEVDVWEEASPPPRPVLFKQLARCQGILTEVDDIMDREALEAGPSLSVVSNRAIGLDNVDLPEATRRGIAIGNTPGVLHESCADFTFALILSVARRVAFADRRVQSGEWKIFDQMPYLGRDVHGATLGLVGFGRIGQAVARRAAGFDMTVLYHSRTRRQDQEDELGVKWVPYLPSLLRDSDFVSVHVPLTEETRYLIGKTEFETMKPGAFLINTSRGGTVDPDALRAALSDGALAGAALDVTDPEPIPPDDPLLGMDNVVVTPHISSASAATVRAMGMMAAENIITALTGGEMPSCVNPEVLRA